MGNKYSKRSLMVGERIIYSAKMHYFCYFKSILFIIIGLLMTDIMSVSQLIDKVDDKSRKRIHSQINNKKQDAKELVDSYKKPFENIIESLPDEFGAAIVFISKIRLHYFGLIFMFIGFINLISTYLNKISSEFVITTKRVIYKFGFVSVDSIEINLDRIEGVKIHRGVVDRIVGRGNVLINSVGFEQIEIKKISKPEKFRNTVLNTIQKYVESR